MGGINFDPGKLPTLGTGGKRKTAYSSTTKTSTSTAANNAAPQDSGKVLDSLTAMGNYNQAGLVSSGSNSTILAYLKANPAVCWTG